MTACVRYYPQPLPECISLIEYVPTEPLGLDEIAAMALCNNPDLVLARDDIGIARAEIFAASLFQDPTLAASQDFPFPSADAVIAFMVGISYDIQSLVLLPGNYNYCTAEWAEGLPRPPLEGATNNQSGRHTIRTHCT